MGWASLEARHGLRSCVFGFAAAAAALTITTNVADARHHRRIHLHVAHHATHVRHAQPEGYSPPSASIVVDGNSGSVLQESNADGLRHPASLTKVMTLYLLFERLEAGKIRLDTPLTVSEHASEQAPTRLGLKPGQSIAVEDAIKAVVTRSANDVAVVIAENLGGSEDAFARQMTQKAHALGMSRTTYVNASGLPDDDQVTSARDQALLGRAIQERFPRYYRFFSTTAFVFRGETIRGHNHLLGSVTGVDGIKTGFTRASGFNLITSIHRDGRYLVGVVLGGRSAFERDSHMRALVETNIREASVRHTAPVVAERGGIADTPQQVAFARPTPPAAPAAKPLPRQAARQPEPARTDLTPTAAALPHVAVGSTEPIRPLHVKTISFRAVTVRTASMAPLPVLVPAEDQSPPAAEAETAAPPSAPEARMASASPEPIPAMAAAPKAEPARVEVATAEPVRPALVRAAAPVNTAPAVPSHVRGGWVIQIGAYEGEQEARQHLNEAQARVHAALAAADPFTETVQKGDKQLYRARFAGFDRATAEAACRQLKRSDFACITLKD